MSHLADLLSYALGPALLYEAVLLVGFCWLLVFRWYLYDGLIQRLKQRK